MSEAFDPLIPPCGKAESNSYKSFTPETLKQHEFDCPTCQLIAIGIDPFDDYDGVPDGAYFAMQAEGAPKGWS